MSTNADATKFLKDLKDAMLINHELPYDIMLGLAAQFVGQLYSVQDMTRHTPESLRDLVAYNINYGNQIGVGHFLADVAGRA